MKIVYLRDALEDMRWVRHYYRNVFPAGQGNARQALRATENTIAQHPHIGHPCEEIATAREYRINRTPFSFLYRVVDDRVEILRVIDNRSDWVARMTQGQKSI
jgi:plasmid stabilization system protein ParE